MTRIRTTPMDFFCGWNMDMAQLMHPSIIMVVMGIITFFFFVVLQTRLSMEKGKKINKGVADLMISLCLHLHEIKTVTGDEPVPNALPFLWTHRDLKDRMDALFGALGMKGMAREARKTKNFVENALVIHGLLPYGSSQKTEIMGHLDQILFEVTQLEQQLTHSLKNTLEK